MRSLGKLILIGVTAGWLFGCGSGASTPGGTGGSATGGTAAGSAGAMAGAGGSANGGSGGDNGARGGTGGATGGGAGGPTGTGGGPSTGCGTSTSLQNGRASIDVSGTAREYILALPSGYDANHPYRLIFGFHWSGGVANDVASGQIIGGPYYGLQSRSAGSAIFVAPEGLNKGWANTGGGDIAFVKAMLAYFEANLCID